MARTREKDCLGQLVSELKGIDSDTASHLSLILSLSLSLYIYIYIYIYVGGAYCIMFTDVRKGISSEVQTLDEVVCISHSAHRFGKNIFNYSPSSNG